MGPENMSGGKREIVSLGLEQVRFRGSEVISGHVHSGSTGANEISGVISSHVYSGSTGTNVGDRMISSHVYSGSTGTDVGDKVISGHVCNDRTGTNVYKTEVGRHTGMGVGDSEEFEIERSDENMETASDQNVRMIDGTVTANEMNKSKRLAGRRKRNYRRVKNEQIPNRIECVQCKCTGLGDGEAEVLVHCNCCCWMLRVNGSHENEGDVHSNEDNSLVQENGYLTSTQDMLDGVTDMIISDDYSNVSLPKLEKNEFERILKMQEESELVMKCKEWLNDESSVPTKSESLNLNSEFLSVLRHISVFRLSQQNIVYRLFIQPDGTFETLIFLHGETLDNLIRSIHVNFGHTSANVLFKIMKTNYYSIGLMRKCKLCVSVCPECIKYNIKKGIKSKASTQLSSQPRREFSFDLSGPLCQSFGYKYIAVCVDKWSRETFLRPCKSCSSEDVLESLISIFEREGLPEFLSVDGGCLSKRKIDRIALEKLGVQLRISNHNSRAQSHSERAIQSTTIRILKLLSKDSSLQGWCKLLDKIQFQLNITPSDKLNGVSPFQLTRRYAMRAIGCDLEPIRQVGRVVDDFNSLVKMMDNVRLIAFKNLVHYKNYSYPTETLKNGSTVFRKKVNFSTRINPKYQGRVSSAFKVESRVGSGHYKVIDIITGSALILPVEQLVRTALTIDQAKKLMEDISV